MVQDKMKNWFKILLVVVFIIALFYIGSALRNYSQMLEEAEAKNKIDGRFIATQLENVGDLTSAKMIYNGIVEYKDGNIPFINQKAFLMLYRAEVRAGIDLSKVETEVTEEMVKIKVPAVQIQTISISPESIKFYDEKSSIFNWINKNDAVEGIKVAEEDVMLNGDIASLRERSKQQTELLLKGLFTSSIGERKLIIEEKE